MESAPTTDQYPSGKTVMPSELALARYDTLDVVISSVATTQPMYRRLIQANRKQSKKIWLFSKKVN